MKTIAVTQRTYTDPNHNEIRDCIDQRWYHFLKECGYRILLIPNNFKLFEELINIMPIDGILLTGGNSTEIRSIIENYLINKAMNENIPLIGVCHGMQVIQSYFNTPIHSVPGHVNTSFNISFNNIIIEINSYHDFGTTTPTPHFKTLAKTDDGVIKSIRHEAHPILGIMWHPERYTPIRQFDRNLIINHMENG